MTPFQEAITIVHRLKVWIADERMGDGALLKSAADLIERLQAEKAEMEKLREQNTALSDALDYLRGLTPQQYEALHKDAKRWRLARTRFIAFDWAWNSPPIPVAIFHMPEVKEVRAGPEGADAAIDAAMEKKGDA